MDIPFIYPLLLAVQESCSRIGAITGTGLAAVIKEHYSRKLLYLSVGLVVVANTLNIGADRSHGRGRPAFIDIPFAILAVFRFAHRAPCRIRELQDLRQDSQVVGTDALRVPGHGIHGRAGLGEILRATFVFRRKSLLRRCIFWSGSSERLFRLTCSSGILPRSWRKRSPTQQIEDRRRTETDQTFSPQLEAG